MSAVILADNILRGALLSATSTAADTDIRNLRDGRTYMIWQSTTTAQQTITIDCGVAKYADAIGVAGYNFAGLLCQLQSSANGVTWTMALEFIPLRDNDLFRFAGASARYWRLIIPVAAAPVRIGVAFIGTAFNFEQPADGYYSPQDATAKFDVAISEGGALLGSVYSHTELSAQASFTYVSDSWFRTSFMPLWDSYLSRGLPFFWSPEFDVAGLTPDVLYVAIKPGSTLAGEYISGARRKFTLQFNGSK